MRVTIKKANLLLYVFLSLFFISCTNKRDEDFFKNRVSSLMKGSKYIESNFIDLTSFEWDEICFKNSTYVKLEFRNFKTKEKKILNLSDKFRTNEDYVKGSPIKKCYSRGEVFSIQKYNYKNIFLIKEI